MGKHNWLLPNQLRLLISPMSILLLVFLLATDGRALLANVTANLKSVSFNKAILNRPSTTPAAIYKCPDDARLGAYKPEDFVFESISQRVRWQEGVVYWLAGDCYSAAAIWGESVRVEPRNPLAWFWLGVAHQDNTELAVDAFCRAGAGKYLLGLAQLVNEQQDLFASLKWYYLAAKTLPTFESVSAAAEAYLRGGQREIAIALWRQWGESLPATSVDRWRALGEAAWLGGNSSEAAHLFEQGVRIAPDDLWLVSRARHAMLSIGDLEGAMRMSKLEVKIAPSEPGSYVDVAAIYRMKGDYETARHWANQGRNIGPDSYLAYDSLGAIACLESNYDEALVNFSKALRLAPKNLYVVIDRASCLHRMGDIASAISYVNEAIVVADVSDPKLIDLYFLLGRWYEENGSMAEARQTYEQALVLWPENSAVRAKLDRLLASEPSSKP